MGCAPPLHTLYDFSSLLEVAFAMNIAVSFFDGLRKAGIATFQRSNDEFEARWEYKDSHVLIRNDIAQAIDRLAEFASNWEKRILAVDEPLRWIGAIVAGLVWLALLYGAWFPDACIAKWQTIAMVVTITAVPVLRAGLSLGARLIGSVAAYKERRVDKDLKARREIYALAIAYFGQNGPDTKG